jgi:hypothetical protein
VGMLAFGSLCCVTERHGNNLRCVTGQVKLDFVLCRFFLVLLRASVLGGFSLLSKLVAIGSRSVRRRDRVMRWHGSRVIVDGRKGNLIMGWAMGLVL